MPFGSPSAGPRFGFGFFSVRHALFLLSLKQ